MSKEELEKKVLEAVKEKIFITYDGMVKIQSFDKKFVDLIKEWLKYDN